MTRTSLVLDVPGARLAADRWPGAGPTAVLLHAGVADRRSWYAVADRLAGGTSVVAYDRRGHGASASSDAPYRDLDDLVAVLAHVGGAPVWLVGSSMGGRLALDLALARPDLVAGLVLLAPAISGAPPPAALDDDTARLSGLLEAADGDLDEVNRLEAWLWLDGPRGPEGRVGGPARQLALDMNAVILGNDVPDDASSVDRDAWSRLHEVAVPVTVAWGDLDLPLLVERCEHLVACVRGARRAVLVGTAHLPYLEQPDAVAALVRAAMTGG